MATVALDVWHEHSLSADPSGIESAVQWLRPIAIHQKRTEPKRISFLLPWRGQRKIGSRCSCSSPSADQFSLCLYLAPIDFENGSASSSFLHLSIFFSIRMKFPDRDSSGFWNVSVFVCFFLDFFTGSDSLLKLNRWHCEKRPKNPIGWILTKISLLIGRQILWRWNSRVNQ